MMVNASTTSTSDARKVAEIAGPATLQEGMMLYPCRRELPQL
jgi:hypothetical protein